MFAAVHEGRLQSVSSPSKTSRRSLTPDRVWNRIPDDIRQRIVSRALDQPELSPRESACCRGLAYHGPAKSDIRRDLRQTPVSLRDWTWRAAIMSG